MFNIALCDCISTTNTCAEPSSSSTFFLLPHPCSQSRARAKARSTQCIPTFNHFHQNVTAGLLQKILFEAQASKNLSTTHTEVEEATSGKSVALFGASERTLLSVCEPCSAEDGWRATTSSSNIAMRAIAVILTDFTSDTRPSAKAPIISVVIHVVDSTLSMRRGNS